MKLFTFFIVFSIATGLIAFSAEPPQALPPQVVPLKDVLEKVKVAGTPHDGDTFTILAPAIRIVGVCSAEIKEPEGIAHRDNLIAWMKDADIYILRKGESYGRTLARVFKKVNGQFVEIQQSDIGTVAGRGTQYCK